MFIAQNEKRKVHNNVDTVHTKQMSLLIIDSVDKFSNARKIIINGIYFFEARFTPLNTQCSN